MRGMQCSSLVRDAPGMLLKAGLMTICEPESEMWYTVDGRLVGSDSLFDKLAGVYKTKDNNYVRIHTNFPQ